MHLRFATGVIDGGPENYSGEGTSLPFHPLSIDRQSSVPWPQPLNHGVGYRESRDTPFAVRLDRLPDGNQDIYFGAAIGLSLRTVHGVGLK